MKIESLILNNDQNIALGKISVLVGPNNVGKSQILRDIQQRMHVGAASKSILIKKIIFEKPPKFEDLFFNLKVVDSLRSIEIKQLIGINNNLSQQEKLEIHYQNFEHAFKRYENVDFFLGNILKFKVAYLDSSTRLNLINTTTSCNPDSEIPANILQKLFLEQENEAMLKTAFKNAFGMDIILDYSGLKDLCLRIAENFPTIPEDPRKAHLITKAFNKIDIQGDGFKSFAGIVLGLLFSNDRIILLDEPEAFLHPAQSRYLGKWIADNSEIISGQIIISTHNANFLSGLLQSDKKIDIYRLNRIGDDTKFKLIPPHATERLTKSPLLSSQRVLEAIFHKAVVVCEADADRIVYQTVSHLYHKNQETLFIHSHNKQALKDVASLLIATQIPTGVITDIDILNDESDFKNLIQSVTQQTISNNLIEKRKAIAKSVDHIPDELVLTEVQNDLEELIKQLKENKHSLSGVKGALNRIQKGTTNWVFPKKKGIEGFNLETREIVTEVIEDLKQSNIFIVPVGELEGWIDVGTSKKNNWIVKALSEIFKGNASPQLIDFVKMILIKVSKER